MRIAGFHGKLDDYLPDPPKKEKDSNGKHSYESYCYAAITLCAVFLLWGFAAILLMVGLIGLLDYALKSRKQVNR